MTGILPRPPETHAPYAAAQGCVLRDGHLRAVSPPGEQRGESPLAGVSVRRVEDITEALWGSKVSPATISELNKRAYVHIEDWRNRPLQGGRYPYVYVDGIYLRRNWDGGTKKLLFWWRSP